MEDEGETTTKQSLLTVASGKHIQHPQIFTYSSFKYLQHHFPKDSLEELLSENALEVQKYDDVYCEKYDQHSEFIPINTFSISHLPEEIRHVSVYIWLKSVAPLVVKLKKDGNATGRICQLAQEKDEERICDDVHCQYIGKMGRNHKVFGGLGIITNRHVVKSDNDAAVTRVEFFYNDETLPPKYAELGVSLRLCDLKFDYSVFSCYVHDKTLIETMKVLNAKRDYSWLQIPEHIRLKTKKYAIVISHPHGRAKKVSIGHIKHSEVKGTGRLENFIVSLLIKLYDICEKQESKGGLMRFEAYYKMLKLKLPYRITWYTTATCRGSSGAPVYMGNTVLEKGQEINQAHTHRGVDNNRKLNVCFT